jgi:hypothetical protein
MARTKQTKRASGSRRGRPAIEKPPIGRLLRALQAVGDVLGIMKLERIAFEQLDRATIDEALAALGVTVS